MKEGSQRRAPASLVQEQQDAKLGVKGKEMGEGQPRASELGGVGGDIRKLGLWSGEQAKARGWGEGARPRFQGLKG